MICGARRSARATAAAAVGTHGSGYLGPEHAGVYLEVNPEKPLPFVSPGPDVYREEQQREFALLGKLNNFSAVEYPTDSALTARIKSYEFAFQDADGGSRSDQLQGRDGGDESGSTVSKRSDQAFGQVCLAARRLSERGVRFVQVYHGGGGQCVGRAQGSEEEPRRVCAAKVDKPIAGLLKDLKQRGLLDETIVVWATEFGRTPGAESFQRPRPSSFRILGLDGGRRHQGRSRARQDG